MPAYTPNKYPAMYGTLSGLFHALLEESGLPPDRIDHYKARFRGIDKQNSFMYDRKTPDEL